MQEYWVNVYEGNEMVCHDGEISKWADRATAAAVAGPNAIYRIHVKMKPVQRLSQIPKYDEF